ncbi:MAG: choice-of-anchor B family protein [Acidobacteria bacterium]|jgi:choice-of-anchor B domain-containing protein|nr:choice-of-anchor B family protein [Acidobacteriota bacterium]
MRTVQRFVLCGAVFAFVAFGLRAETGAREAADAAMGFGGAVIVGDGEVFVGEAANQFRPGLVYVYRKAGTGWQEAAVLRKPDAAVGDRFGSSLALDGSRLFVGAGPAAVHLFEKRSGAWTHSGVIANSAVTGAEGVQFSAIGAAGDWLFVGQQVMLGGRRGGGPGAAATAAPALPAGKVFAFKRGADGQYAFVSTLTAPDQPAGDGFGASIAMSASSALIGAVGQNNRAGLVHEFELDAAGAWTRARSFTPQGAGPADMFGTSINFNGQQAVVTAPGDAGGYGAAYVWMKVQQAARGGGAGAAGQTPPAGGNFVWAEQARLTQSVGSRANGFASAVAADDTQVWVTAPRAGGAGAVAVFTRDAATNTIAGPNMLVPANMAPSANAGQSVSLRGSVAAIGATGVGYGGGAVIIYERDASGAWAAQPMLSPALDELPALLGEERKCNTQGKVEVFDCASTELTAFLPPSKLTHDGHYIQMNDIWGWTDSRTGKEWALVGRRDGSTFVDMSNGTRPIAVADLPLTDGARPAAWRDIKIYKDHAYIVSDGAGPHGMQVFDLTRLRTLKPQANGQPVKVEYDYLYKEIASAHNIVINEDSGYAYSVGSSAGGTTCGGGLHMIDIREPKLPKFAGCFADNQTGRAGTGYSHDAQCVTYKGPDKRYKGREICIGSNENTISIADVTDKANPKALSRAGYPNVAYAHQGWLTDDHTYYYLNDEGDETGGLVTKTRTLVWNLTDLENPKLAKEHMGVEAASDHNLYIQGDYMYQANYRSGLRILNIKDRENPREVAYFDTAPYTDNGAGFNGAWSVFPFFKSGIIIVNSIEQGLFLVRPTDRPVRR